MFKRTSILHNAQMSLPLYLIVSFLLKLTETIITLSMRFRTYLVIKTTCVELSSRSQFTSFEQLKNKQYDIVQRPGKAKTTTVAKLSMWRGYVVCGCGRGGCAGGYGFCFLEFKYGMKHFLLTFVPCLVLRGSNEQRKYQFALKIILRECTTQGVCMATIVLHSNTHALREWK